MKTQELLDNYREQFTKLAEYVTALDTIRNVEDMLDVKSRQHAIEIVEGWMSELFEIDKEDLEKLIDKDDMFKVRE
jgi:hypothetical protein